MMLIGCSECRHVHLNLSARLINYGTVFFSHNKTTSIGLSVAETISRTARQGPGAPRPGSGARQVPVATRVLQASFPRVASLPCPQKGRPKSRAGQSDLGHGTLPWSTMWWAVPMPAMVRPSSIEAPSSPCCATYTQATGGDGSGQDTKKFERGKKLTLMLRCLSACIA
jgi:hypothetical protein